MDRPAALLNVLPQVDAEIPFLPGRSLKYVAPRLSSSARSRPNLSVQAPHPPLVTDLIQSFEPDYRAPFLAHPNRSSTSTTAAAGAAGVSASSMPALRIAPASASAGVSPLASEKHDTRPTSRRSFACPCPVWYWKMLLIR